MRSAAISHVAQHASGSATVSSGLDGTVPLADAPGARAIERLLGRADAERPPPGATRHELRGEQHVARASTAGPPPGVPVRPASSRSTRSSIPEIAP